MVGAGKRAKPKNLMAFGRNPLLALAKQPISPWEERLRLEPRETIKAVGMQPFLVGLSL
jgi:hypothetical protein